MISEPAKNFKVTGTGTTIFNAVTKDYLMKKSVNFSQQMLLISRGYHTATNNPFVESKLKFFTYTFLSEKTTSLIIRSLDYTNLLRRLPRI